MVVYVTGMFRGRPGRAHLDPECISIRQSDLLMVDSSDPFAAALEPCHLCGDPLASPMLSWPSVMNGAPRGWLEV